MVTSDSQCLPRIALDLFYFLCLLSSYLHNYIHIYVHKLLRFSLFYIYIYFFYVALLILLKFFITNVFGYKYYYLFINHYNYFDFRNNNWWSKYRIDIFRFGHFFSDWFSSIVSARRIKYLYSIIAANSLLAFIFHIV